MELKKGYKQTEIGVIPEDWEVVNLPQIGNVLSGLTYSPEDVVDYGTLVLRSSNIQEGALSFKNNVFVDMDLPENVIVKENDILICVRNGSKDLIGKCALIDKKTEGSAFGAFMSLFRAKSFKYTFFQFQSDIIQTQIKKSLGATINQITNKDLSNFQIPLPPTLKEQKAIAQILSDTDQLIQNLKALVAKKKAIKQGAMQELLTGKKRLQGFTEEWETKKLGEVAFIKTGSKNNQDKVNDGDYPFFVRSQSVERINTYSYDCEAILVPGEGGIGSIFHYINGKFDVHQRVYVINDFSQNVFGKYIYLFMKEHFGTHAMKNSVKATVDSLRLPTFQEFEIKLPKDIKEQQAIAQILSDMDSEIAALEQQLQKTQALKQGMMQELLTGKTRLVQPVTQEKTVPLAMVAEPEVVYKKETKPKKHNEHINDAVLIGTMADAFGSENYPLTRFMYTKVSYLLKRYKEEQDAGYLKKAAGPYKPKTRYAGAEKIALKNGYVKMHTSNYNGKKYENFLAGDNVTEAINYFKDWYGENALQWIQQFKYTKRNKLELWATVDMAIEDLKQENKPINFETVKQLINNHKEWRPKLKRSTFSDPNIKEAISEVNQLFNIL